MREVAVTGIGVVLPGCDSHAEMWRILSQGESQLAIEEDPATPGEFVTVGRVDFDPDTYLNEFPKRFYRGYDRETQLYLASLLLARDDANIRVEEYQPERIGLFDGCSRPMFSSWYARIQREVKHSPLEAYSRRDLAMGTPGQAAGIAASLLEVRGSVFTYNSTCSSGAVAIGHAFREIRDGELDLAFATGHECSLSVPMFAMYREGSLLSSERSDPTAAVRPYGDCLGNAFSEGAVTLVLEPLNAALQRGARVFGLIRDFKYGNNGFHPTTPDMSGGQPARLVRELCSRTDVPLEDIGFVVGHGNAVQLSDASEINCMLLLFQERAREVPLLSNKPVFGHTLGASSSVNAAACLLMLENDFIVPTINVNPDLANPFLDHMSGTGAYRECKAGVAISLGLGGNNTVLLFKKFPQDSQCS